MKRNKKINKKNVGLVLLIIGIIGFIGAFTDTGFSVDTALGSVFFIAIGIVLLAYRKKPRNTITTTAPQSPAPHQEPKKEVIPDGTKNYDLFHDFIDGQFLCQEYEENVCIIGDAFDAIVGNGGKQITFEFEPENEYDSKAIALYVEGKKIGYVYQGQTQDMIHSYHKQNRQNPNPVISHRLFNIYLCLIKNKINQIKQY